MSAANAIRFKKSLIDAVSVPAAGRQSEELELLGHVLGQRLRMRLEGNDGLTFDVDGIVKKGDDNVFVIADFLDSAKRYRLDDYAIVRFF